MLTAFGILFQNLQKINGKKIWLSNTVTVIFFVLGILSILTKALPLIVIMSIYFIFMISRLRIINKQRRKDGDDE